MQCKKENAPKSDNNNEHLVPKELIDKIAAKFNPNKNRDNSKPTTPGSDSIDVISLLDRTINNCISIPDKNNITAFYIYNYTNSEGWVIISADDRMEPILAFSDHGNITPGIYPSGFLSWFDRTIEEIELLRDNLYDNTVLAKTAWWVLLDENDLDSYTAAKKMKPALTDPCLTATKITKGPLLPVTWGQGCAFNANCPTLTCSTVTCNRALTGCVATAMSQVVRYWQSPVGYNYSAMPRNAGNADVADLMNDAGVAVNMSYGCNASSAYTSDVDDALKSSAFNYSSADYHSSFSLSNVEANVHALKPAIIAGCNTKTYVNYLGIFTKLVYDDCHAWVCDGCMHYTYCNTSSTLLFLHMNWGWQTSGGTNNLNGWFSVRNWTVSTNVGPLNYQYATKEVVNIHP